MNRGLKISAQLTLPVDFVTKTCGILAQRRKGKTYTASVMAEELVALQQPFVALDPTGAWWGLRSSADGKRAGLPVVIIGGRHGDVPVSRTDGKFVADLVVDNPGYYVIDFSHFESNESERQFATDFMERLYRVKGQEGKDFPMHLFVDEADRFAPQRPQPGDQRMLGATEAIVRRGGLRGLGTTLVSQRAAVVNKNVLEQVDILVLLRTVGPNDRKAVDDYVVSHGTDEERKALKESMSSLGLGEAWIWEPGADEPLFNRVQIRERKTFNSSATPKPGEVRIEPKRLADVDIDQLRERMTHAIEKAQADDPKVLRKIIAELKRQIAEAEMETRTVEVEVEVAVIPQAMLDWLGDLDAWRGIMANEAQALREVMGNAPKWPPPGLSADGTPVSGIRTQTRTPEGTKEPVKPVPSQFAPVAKKDNLMNRFKPDDGVLTGPQRKLLTVLATYGPRTKTQLALQAGYSKGGGAFNNPLGKLRSQEYVTRGEPITITEEGLSALGEYTPLPTGEDLLDHWLNQLPGPPKKLLASLAYEGPATRAELAARTGYSVGGGAFNNPLGKLRTLELVARGEPVQLTDDFRDAIGM